MKKLILFFTVLISISAFAVPPIKGGYLGRRFIVAGEFAYSPNYYSLQSVLTSFNPQYGANVQVVTGRYWQIGVNYCKFALGDVIEYEIANPGSKDKVTGTVVGVTARKFRERKGGLAPIGKFVELGIYNQRISYKYLENGYTSYSDELEVSTLNVTLGLGVQEIFWDHVAANCGVRFGGKVFNLESTTTNTSAYYAEEIVKTRMTFHNAFTPFAGIGLIF
jgi:hypothetical protein